MDLLYIVGISAGLAADATAVSIGAGITLDRVDPRRVFRMSFHFGLFQAGMPLLGWLAATRVLTWFEAWDHWVAFGLLVFVGGKMIWEGIARKEGEKKATDPTRGLTLVMLSVATSIDAFAVGLSLGLLDQPILLPCAVIGVVTVLMSASGMVFGRSLGKRFGKGMTVAGGVVLLGIGIRILVGHLWLGGG